MTKPMAGGSLNAILASTVRNLRRKRGLSQEELASLASVDRTYISGIERARRNITILTLERLIPHLCDSTIDFFKHLCSEIDEQPNSISDGTVLLDPDAELN